MSERIPLTVEVSPEILELIKAQADKTGRTCDQIVAESVILRGHAQAAVTDGNKVAIVQINQPHIIEFTNLT